MPLLLRDVWYGLRILRRTPSFTLLAAISLALGIGGSTALFSVADRLILTPLPIPEPNRLVSFDLPARRAGRVDPMIALRDE